MAHQYDRWHQKFTVKDQNGKILVPSDAIDPNDPDPDVRGVQGMSILINDVEYKDTDGTLVYDGNTTKQWRAYIDEEQTDLERILTFQCEVDFGDPYSGTQNNIIHSDKTNDRLSPSLDWSNDD